VTELTRVAKNMIQAWDALNVPVETRLAEALAKIEQMHEDRLALDRRIRCQRATNRETWEIVEQRRKWLGSKTSREWCIRQVKNARRVSS